MSRKIFAERVGLQADSVLVFRDIQNATNQRTFIASIIPNCPAGNKVPQLLVTSPADQLRVLAACNSFASDSVLRRKMSQGTVNWFYAEEVPLASRSSPAVESIIQRLACALSFHHARFAPAVMRMERSASTGWRSSWAITDAERLRVRSMLDAILLKLYGLDWTDSLDLLADCDHPVDMLADRNHARGLHPKGFWRVDRVREPELRHTVLTLVACRDLQTQINAMGGDDEAGILAFCAQNNGEGWMLPETLRLADFGLGHDERATKPQPVASCLGPRFLEWQLSENQEESWRECGVHARNLLGSAGYQHLLNESKDSLRGVSENAQANSDKCDQGKLF